MLAHAAVARATRSEAAAMRSFIFPSFGKRGSRFTQEDTPRPLSPLLLSCLGPCGPSSVNGVPRDERAAILLRQRFRPFPPLLLCVVLSFPQLNPCLFSRWPIKCLVSITPGGFHLIQDGDREEAQDRRHPGRFVQHARDSGSARDRAGEYGHAAEVPDESRPVPGADGRRELPERHVLLLTGCTAVTTGRCTTAKT